MFANYLQPKPQQIVAITASAAVGSASPRPGPCSRRLHEDLRLHVALRHVHRCGPRAIGYCLAETLDAIGADPACLDGVLRWRQLNPDLVAAFAGTDFPRPPLDLLPPDLGQ